MKARVLLISLIITIISSMALAQDITRNDIFRGEWEMKSRYFQNLEARKGASLLLNQNDYDVKYWEIDLNVTDLVSEIIYGVVSMTSEAMVNNLTSVDYDFHFLMSVDSVKMGGQLTTYSRTSSMMSVDLDRAYNYGEQFTTVVYYHGHPPGSGWGSFVFDTTRAGDPIISTLSEPEGAREWWPCKDMPTDKADSADIIITVPDNLVATSNGVLIAESNNGNGTKTFHWKTIYPITTYLISVAISNYQSFTDWYVYSDNDSMPIVNYVYPVHYNSAVTDLGITPQILGIFAGYFGEYPFINEKYGHSIFPWGGAMEHQCNTSYGNSLIRGDHYFDYILVHEAAHQWFGDMISCDTWPDIWMNEGFASYLESLWQEYTNGQQAYINYMLSYQLVEDPSGPIYDPDPLFGQNTVYNKGAWVLHMLRGVMGDTAFFDGMYAYANHPDHKYGTVQTHQFQSLMEQYYGSDLSWFFQEWVWGMNRPFYRYSWMKEDIGSGQYEVFLHIDQIQGSPAPSVFTMPVKIDLRVNGVDTTVTVWNDSRADDLRIIVNGNPNQLGFDTKFWILRSLNYEAYTMNIVVTDLPNAIPNQYYEHTIEARGGNLPYAFSITSGSLPEGISLNSSTGVISGMAADEGSYDFTVQCVDNSSPAIIDDQNYTLHIGTVTDTNDQNPLKPTGFELFANYPNPFNMSTKIKFRISEPGPVNLAVFNLLGQKVETLHDGYLSSGEYLAEWTGNKVPSGVYFYKLTSAGKSDVRKMTLVK